MNVLTLERSFICDIINQKYPHCTPIVCRCNGSKPLLAGSIPYLQLYAFAVKLDSSNLEINTNRGDKGWCEGVLAETQEAA